MHVSRYMAPLLIAILASHLVARPVEDWSYDKLFQSADVVVIATAESTVDTSAKPSDPKWAQLLVGQDTRFRIEKVVQGKLPAGEITVQHFRYAAGQGTIDGPFPVAFRTTPLVFEGLGTGRVSLGTPQYLLFLKATAGGSFAPVTGEMDPTSSVREIYQVLPSSN